MGVYSLTTKCLSRPVTSVIHWTPPPPCHGRSRQPCSMSRGHERGKLSETDAHTLRCDDRSRYRRQCPPCAK